MSSTLQHEIHKRRPFDSPEQEAFLNLMRTWMMLVGEFDAMFRAKGLSSATYNVLRILRGAGPSGRMCHEIADHMVTRVPDVTRLVDRLEQGGYASRERSTKDRRVVHVKITEKGLGVLAELDKPVMDLHAKQLGHLARADLETLSRLLSEARNAPVPVKGAAAG